MAEKTLDERMSIMECEVGRHELRLAEISEELLVLGGKITIVANMRARRRVKVKRKPKEKREPEPKVVAKTYTFGPSNDD